MADPNAFYEPEEDELLSSLAVPAYQSGNDASYEDEYRRLQELEQHAYAQQMAAREQAELEHSQILEMVPEDVKRVSICSYVSHRSDDHFDDWLYPLITSTKLQLEQYAGSVCADYRTLPVPRPFPPGNIRERPTDNNQHVRIRME